MKKENLCLNIRNVLSVLLDQMNVEKKKEYMPYFFLLKLIFNNK